MTQLTNNYRWRTTDLDNDLLLELASTSPCEDKIRRLVKQGANINSLNGYGESVLMDAIGFLGDGLPEVIVRLLIDLGAEVNHADEDGSCPLSEAIGGHNPPMVTLLLEKGADPNVVIEQSYSLLDHAELDHWYHSDSMCSGSDEHIGWAIDMAVIVETLKRFGAKNLEDLQAEEVKDWLPIFGAYTKTGLLTFSGYIEIDRIEGVSYPLSSDFQKWLNEHWDSYPDKAWDTRPSDFDRERHNAEGRGLAKQIANQLLEGTTVRYLFIDAIDEARGVRNVNREIIS